MLFAVNKTIFSQRKTLIIFSKIPVKGAACIRRGLYDEEHFNIHYARLCAGLLPASLFPPKYMACHGFIHKILSSDKHLPCNISSASLN